MTHRTIVGKRSTFSTFEVLKAVGDELGQIKADDKLTWGDVAAVLGVTEGQAPKYADGTAAMSIVTYARAKREWNGRFTGKLDRLCHDSRPGPADRECESRVLKAALALSIALADDNAIDAHEVHANRATIEAARDALDTLLDKLAPRSAA